MSVRAASASGGARWDTDHALARLHEARRVWREAHHHHLETGVDGFPSRVRIDDAMVDLKAALYPQRLGEAHGRGDEGAYVGAVLDRALSTLFDQVRLELRYRAPRGAIGDTARVIDGLIASLPGIRALIDSDVEAAYFGDPAAGSIDEILICYPGVLALIHHRIAHRLYRLGAPLVARIVAERAHSRTGIDIHPGAAIGAGFFIDHGTGVVIGETAIIGDRVRLYQAVTLGARRLLPGEEGGVRHRFPRHPIIEDDVVIYAGATILGRVTIGRGSTIGGNVWLLDDVPPDSLVSQGDVNLRVIPRNTATDNRFPR